MAPMTPLPHPLRCLSFELCHSQGSDDGHWVVCYTVGNVILLNNLNFVLLAIKLSKALRL